MYDYRNRMGEAAYHLTHEASRVVIGLTGRHRRIDEYAIAVVFSVLAVASASAQLQDPRDIPVEPDFSAPRPAEPVSATISTRDVLPNPFTNSGFEAGNFNGWGTTDITFPSYGLRVADSVKPGGTSFFTTGPLRGNRSAVHGFSGSGANTTVEIWQDIVLPDEAVYIAFDYRFGTDMRDPGILADAFFNVIIDDFGGGGSFPEQHLIARAPNGEFIKDTGIRTGRVDVRHYAGQSIRVRFNWSVPPGFTGPGLFEFDNIRVEGSTLYSAISNDSMANVSTSTGVATSFGVTGTFFDSMAYDRNTDTVYAVLDTPHLLVTVNQQHGGVKTVGSLTNNFVDGLAFDPNSNTLYGATNGGQLYAIDTASAQMTLIGNIGVGNISGLAYDRFSDTLWASFSGSIYRINTTTAAPTLFMNLGSITTTCLAFNEVDRNLYALEYTNNNTIRFNLDLATLTIIGNTGKNVTGLNGMTYKAPRINSMITGTANSTALYWTGPTGFMGDQLFSTGSITGGLAYNRNDGIIYHTDTAGFLYEILENGTSDFVALDFAISGGLAYDPNSDTLYGTGNSGNLYAIDPSTGETLLIGTQLSSFIGGLAFDRFTNTLYGVNDFPNPNPSTLVTIDTETGAQTLVGQTSHEDLDALTFNEEDGYLYAMEENTSTLVRIDPTNGTSVFIGFFRTAAGTPSFGSVSGLTNLAEAPTQLVEQFENDDNDMSYLRLTFVPDPIDPTVYTGYREHIASWSAGPFTGSILPLGDDAFQKVDFTAGKTFDFFGESYSSVYVGSNGYVTFGEGKSGLGESIINHYTAPRISALFDDLKPQNNVRFRQFWDRAVISWIEVSEYFPDSSNSFQIELFFGGTIRITYLDIEAQDGLVGLSAGGGVPERFVEGDMSNLTLFVPDTDKDGFEDFYELQLNIDPVGGDNDKDGDGLTDAEEFFTYGTNMYLYDGDGDGLSDGEEINTYSTNPFVADSDGDNFIDGEEVAVGTNPNGPGSVPDPATWVDFGYSGPQTGTFVKPYDTILEGRINVPSFGKIRIMSGNTNETIFINKAITIESIGGTTRIGVAP